jgi:hypothetical protein
MRVKIFLLFGRVHVGFAHILNKRRSKPNGCSAFLMVQLIHQNVGLKRIIDAIDRCHPAKVKTIDKVPDATRPEVREMDEESDQGRAQLLDHDYSRLILEQLEKPADEICNELVCIMLSQPGTASSQFLICVKDRFYACLPVPIQLDNEGQGSVELDVVIRICNQILGKLPSVWRSLEPLQDFLDFGDGPWAVGLVQGLDQLEREWSANGCVKAVKAVKAPKPSRAD